jgi:hypothetical protein
MAQETPQSERPPRHDAPKEDAYWELRGRIGQWMDQYGVPPERTLLSLARIMAELRLAQDCHVLARLQALEEAGEEDDLLR